VAYRVPHGREVAKTNEKQSMKSENRKSMFFVSLPKSGTGYTWTCLSDMTGLKMPEFHLLEGWEDYNSGRDFSCPDIYACGDYNTQLLRPEQMKIYLQGYVFGAHMQASYHNMRILEESGITRITVLLRDPRDAFVSWVHHLRELGLPARNYHSRIYHIPRDYYDWSVEEQFDFQVRSFLPTTINWVEGWLDYYAAADRKVDILFVLYDELKRDPLSYMKRIFEFHEIDDVDYSKLVVPEEGKLHFRKGEHEQWRVDFSPGNQRLASEMLQDRISRGFELAARSHRGRLKYDQALSIGNYALAAGAALEVITQFPNSAESYQLLYRAAEASKLDVADLRRKVAKELGEQSIAENFRYRYELVAECKRLVQQLGHVVPA